MQSQQTKPGWASNMEDAKYETICALYRAAHDMEPDKHVEDMTASDVNHYAHIYQVSRLANFKWARNKIRQLITPRKLKLQREKYNKRMSYKQRCTETVIMIKMSNGKCKALRALLDSGCTKTIILK